MQQNNSNKTPFGPERDQDQKPNRKPIIYYYLIVAAFMLVFNWLIVPWMAQRQVVQVTYTQFDQMLKDDQVTAVQIGEGELLFTAKVNGKEGAFKTGQVDDPDLVAHLGKRTSSSLPPFRSGPTYSSTSY